MANELYFDPDRNLITAVTPASPSARVIQKSDVAELVRNGAEVDDSARKLNELLKTVKGA